MQFNGLIFTANKPKDQGGPGVDFRDWGGLSWWQNERDPYYSMLPTGDADLLATLLDCFRATLPLAEARTKHYFKHSGAVWPEYTHPLFGTTHPNSYGCGRAGKTEPPIGHSDDRWNGYNWQGSLDLSLFVLDHWAYTQNKTALAEYLPIIEAVVDFYAQHWPARDSNGKIIIYPTQAVETWQCPGWPAVETNCVTNDTPTVAGLHSVIQKLLLIKSPLVGSAQIQAWSRLQAQLPPIPTKGTGLNTVVLPGEKLPPHTSNSENPQLYVLHPYRVYSAGKADATDAETTTVGGGGSLHAAMLAFWNKTNRGDEGWNQVAPDAAFLGLGNLSAPGEAPQLVAARAATESAGGYRFPAFMPHMQDYEPSADHLGMFSSALTAMLIQPKDDANYGAVLLPAWPCEWDVTFKLAAPKQTLVEGTLKGGTLSFTVEPASRKPFITVAKCQ
jgi:hypothetical protein